MHGERWIISTFATILLLMLHCLNMVSSKALFNTRAENENNNDNNSAEDQLYTTEETNRLNSFTSGLGLGASVAWRNNSLEEPQNDTDSFPEHLQFSDKTLVVIIVYCVLFVIAAIGNLTVFITLFRSRHRKSRISLMITHLAIADLMVTFIMIPLEVGWRITVQWLAGNMACKVFLFLRAFGLYLSSNVLVCVSLDRYFAILHPLRVNDARRRGKIMLACAWLFSLMCSAPQSIVFHVSRHPQYPKFSQCVSFGFFQSPVQEMAYNLFCVLVMYFIPLVVIIVSYTTIMWEIFHKSKEKNDCYTCTGGRMRLRRSDMSNIERARRRTLKMTITIVLVFVWCWTPYVIMTLWYMFDRESAVKVSNWIQDAFFMMAVSNSCMNPLVYGSYAMNCRKECCRCFGCIMWKPKSPTGIDRKGTDVNSGAGQGGIKRRVIKCVYTLRKVGSGATRSTGMLHGAMRSPTAVREVTSHAQPPKPVQPLQRPLSVGELSIVSETMDKGGAYRSSFHSEPIGQSQYLYDEGNMSDIELQARSMHPPDRTPP